VVDKYARFFLIDRHVKTVKTPHFSNQSERKIKFLKPIRRSSLLAVIISIDKMTAASSSGLRSRKVDPKRTMAVIRFDQVDELERDSMINTMIPQAATGVEKEEEEVF
jgi:hypothetical protein